MPGIVTAVRTRRARARRGDGGFTLIEVLVSLTLITIVLAVAATVFIGAVAASATNHVRDRGYQLANQQVEHLMALPWNSLGLFKNDCGPTGYPATNDAALSNEPAYYLGDTRNDPQAPYPLQGGACQASQPAVVVHGVAYTIETHVTLQQSDSADYTELKHLLVVVRWHYGGVDRSLTLDALRAPTAQDVTPPLPDTLTVTPSVTPTSQSLTTDGALTSALALSATTNETASSVVVTYRTQANPSQTLTLTSTDGFAWTGSIPQTTTQRFDAGVETFTFTATSPATTNNASADVTLVAPPDTGTCLDSVSVQPTAMTLSAVNLTTTSALTLQAATVAGQAANKITVFDSQGKVNAVLTNPSGSSWSTSLAQGSGPFAAGADTLTFTAVCQAGGNAKKTATVQFTPENAGVTFAGFELTSPTGSIPICQTGGSGKWSATVDTTFTVSVQNVVSTDTVKLTFPNGTIVTAAYAGTSGGGVLNFTATVRGGTQVVDNKSFDPVGTPPDVPPDRLTVIATANRSSDGAVASTTPPGSFSVTPC